MAKKDKKKQSDQNDLLAGMSVDPDAKRDTTDRLGGGWSPLPSNIYLLEIKSAHLDQSEKGARCLVLSAVTKDGKQYNETIYFTNKDGENFYMRENKQTGQKEKHMNQNFMRVDSLCQLVLDTPLAKMKTQMKYVKVWEEGKQVDRERPMLVDLVGAKVKAGILETLKDKEARNKKGEYEPTGEVRRGNEIAIFFHRKSNLTQIEREAGVEEAAFHDKWLEVNEGNIRDTVKAGTGGSGSVAKKSGSGRPKAGLYD